MDVKSNAALEAEDPRYHAIGVWEAGTASIATIASFRDLQVGFGLPSAPALFLNLATSCWKKATAINLDDIFTTHPNPQGTFAEDHRQLFDYFENSIAHILLSYLAIESFVNSRIPTDFKMPESVIKPKSARILSREDVERYVSLDDKLKKVLPKIENTTSVASNQWLWEAYNRHKTLRDRVVHLKSIDMKGSFTSVHTIWSDLLALGKTNFAESSIAIIRHYLKEDNSPRWTTLYPYPEKQD